MSMDSTCDQHRHSSSISISCLRRRRTRRSCSSSSCKINHNYDGIRDRSETTQCRNRTGERKDYRYYKWQRNYPISSSLNYKSKSLSSSSCNRLLGNNTFRRNIIKKTRTRITPTTCYDDDNDNKVSKKKITRRRITLKSSKKNKSFTILRRIACVLQILFTIHHLQLFQTGNALLVDQVALDVGGGGGGGGNGGGATAVSGNNGGHYLDKFGNLERSVGAVFLKVAYGTTSTTKRSIPDNSYVPSLTTVATPQLTTLRYLEKSQHQQQINLHHRNYELDLERDHALPTSAPNADILKSNSNPTYPNPNRHHNHDRDRHRHILNSTPSPSIHNLSKKGPPTIPMYPGDIPSYSPPARSFFTPPLPPEYQNPFADKPTLRGTNNDAGIVNPGTYLNRRPLPPPSLTPGHERIPLRPPDLNGPNQNNNQNTGQTNYLDPDGRISPNNMNGNGNGNGGGGGGGITNIDLTSNNNGKLYNEDGQRKKALNTPSQKINSKVDNNNYDNKNIPGYGNGNLGGAGNPNININETIPNAGLLHFPSISRILSGSNGRKEEIPEVLLRTVTVRPSNHPPSSPVKKLQTDGSNKNANINHSKNSDDQNSYISNIDMKSDNNNNNNNGNNDDDQLSSSEDIFDVFGEQTISIKNPSSSSSSSSSMNHRDDDNDEPKTQPKIKMSTKSTVNPNDDNIIYSTHIVHNLANINNDKNLLTTISTITKTTSIPIINNGISSSSSSSSGFDNKNKNNNYNTDQTSSNANGNSNGGNDKSTTNDNDNVAPWAVALNIHVYLSAILFTILAVYSIFKMIFYDKLTHLFNQSYFICIHLILIIICMTRIFYLCYDAYNIHESFHLFVSEILLNLPATFLTISFSVLILFLLIRSLNHKNNRYSSLIRPLTVVVGSSVHVGLCITLHYVESYTTTQNQQIYYQQQQLQLQQQQQLYRNTIGGNYRLGSSGSGGSAGSSSSSSSIMNNNYNYNNYNNHNIISSINNYANFNNINSNYNNLLLNHQLLQHPPSPPRVLSLICQIIYIFVCLSLGLLYLYIYRILKRVLRSKSQNYIHGYQNLSYAIHITIATALLYVLLAALQIYGAISISTTRPLITSQSEIDWLQWGYQFSLRLIEIAIITLMSWVAGLKTGGNSGVLQREKQTDTHNVSGFALFPCTSSSSQEHFETDYPAVCNANTNLHTYTLRTGKPIYDDNFALNSLNGNNSNNTGGGGGVGGNSSTGGGGNINNSNNNTTSNNNIQQQQRNNDFQIQNSNEFVRSYETSSLRSTSANPHSHHHSHSHHSHSHHPHHHSHQHQTSSSTTTSSSMIHPSTQMLDQDFINDSQTDHYENPNFELRSSSNMNKQDNCYSEPLNPLNSHEQHVNNNTSASASAQLSRYDFQNFERPIFGQNSQIPIERSNSRNELQLTKSQINKQLIKSNINHLDRSNYENPDRRSSNSTHSCNSGRNYPSYNSFERRNNDVRKSGTLSNIGGVIHGRNGSSSSSSSSSRPSGIQTLSSTHNRTPIMTNNQNSSATGRNIVVQQGGVTTSTAAATALGGGGVKFYRDRSHRSSLERTNNSVMQQYMMQSDDDMIPERANLIKSVNNISAAGITTSSTSGNLTDTACIQQQQQQQQQQLSTSVSASHQVAAAASSSSGDSATSGSMLVAEHGFVRFRALDDMNNAQGVGIHNASIRANGRNKDKRFINNT